jgi:hypothetical protein
MPEAVATEPIPVVVGADNVMRVRGSRVSLDTILEAFGEGATARRSRSNTRPSRWPMSIR